MKLKIGPPEELLAAIRTEVDRRIRSIRDEFGIELGRLAAECWAVGTLGFDAYIQLKPAITRELSGLDRLDLAVEHVVLGPTWDSAFSNELRCTARRNLKTAEVLARLEQKIRVFGSAESAVHPAHDRLVVIGPRVFWVYEESVFSDPGDLCARSDAVELELLTGSCMRYATEHHRHVLFCERCRKLKVLTGVMDALVGIDLRVFQARLRLLDATQRVDHGRVDRLLERQTPELRQDWLHAAELLGWRALVAASYLSNNLQLRHLVPEDAEPPFWSVLQKGEGHPDAVRAIGELDPALIEAGLTATLLTRMWWQEDCGLDPEFEIPTDGDLAEFGWAAPIREATDLDEWARVLGYAPVSQPVRPYLLEFVETTRWAAMHLARDSASPAAPLEPQAAQGLLKNIHDIAWVTAERVQELVRRVGAATDDEIRERLIGLLGANVFDALSHESKQLLIDAERVFADGQINPNLALWSIAKAFELRVTCSVLPLLKDLLGETTLFAIEDLLRGGRQKVGCPAPVRQRLSRAGLEADRVGMAIARVRPVYNELKHSSRRATREEVRVAREEWYGLRPGVPGVFQAVMPSGSAPT